jgi:hypothetical protein
VVGTTVAYHAPSTTSHIIIIGAPATLTRHVGAPPYGCRRCCIASLAYAPQAVVTLQDCCVQYTPPLQRHFGTKACGMLPLTDKVQRCTKNCVVIESLLRTHPVTLQACTSNTYGQQYAAKPARCELQAALRQILQTCTAGA